MGPPRSRKGIHTAKKKFHRKYVLSTKHRAKDIDQIHDELVKRTKIDEDVAEPPQQQEFDPDLPGGGLYYCLETARYFVSQDALDKHKQSKQYKQRVKELRTEAKYTQDSAEAALGITKETLPKVFDQDL